MIKAISINHETVQPTATGRKVTATLYCDSVTELEEQGSSTVGMDRANILYPGDELTAGSVAYDKDGNIAALDSSGDWNVWG